MSLIGHYSKTRGDTLVEVLFATAVFSLVAVSCLSIMNQGAASAQRAFEITLVRNEIDAQAEALRFLNASYISAYQPGADDSLYEGSSKEWRDISSSVGVDANVSALGSGVTCELPDTSFILNARKALYVEPVGLGEPGLSDSFSQVNYDDSDNFKSADGIWIEATKVDPPGTPGGYIDFHIRACWDSPGQSNPMTLGTIVRLYEPM